ncbi:MAG TPA: STAS domain-containing protein [Acidimicrobiales bacterium]|nr:STAS domain-containing protein [Acidimicrobiales bacterium]
MHVKFDHTEAGVVCQVMGNLENLTVGDFREDLAQLPPEARVIFDLSAVPFVDSSGLGALIGAIRRIREHGGDAVVCSVRPSVGRVLELVGLNRIVTVVSNLRDAQAHFLPAA